MVRETSSSGLASLENTVSTQSSKYPLPTRSADPRAGHQTAGGTILTPMEGAFMVPRAGTSGRFKFLQRKDRNMAQVPTTRPPKILPTVDIGTRESALCTIANVGTALATLREVRKNVRGDHKRRLDDVAVILRVIALEAQATFAITDEDALAFIRECRRDQPGSRSR